MQKVLKICLADTVQLDWRFLIHALYSSLSRRKQEHTGKHFRINLKSNAGDFEKSVLDLNVTIDRYQSLVEINVDSPKKQHGPKKMYHFFALYRQPEGFRSRASPLQVMSLSWLVAGFGVSYWLQADSWLLESGAVCSGV
jgi:hypothetical protein